MMIMHKQKNNNGNVMSRTRLSTFIDLFICDEPLE